MKAKKLISVLLALLLVLPTVGVLAPSKASADDGVASYGGTTYATLKEAVDAAIATNDGQEVKLLKDAAGDGIKVESGSTLTIDLGGHTYDVDGTTVGSPRTPTNGFQLLKNSTITIKNGTITSTKAKILIQNYSNLTLNNVVLDGSQLKSYKGLNYTLSNNFGDTHLQNNTKIIAKEGGVAFDVYYGMLAKYDAGVTVTIDETVEIDGKIEYAKASRASEEDFQSKADIVIPANSAIELPAPEGYEWAEMPDGKKHVGKVANMTVAVDGKSGITTTTTITVTFDASVAGLENGDFTLTPAGLTISNVTADADKKVYTLTVAGEFDNNTSLNVKVQKDGYSIKPADGANVIIFQKLDYDDSKFASMEVTTQPTKLKYFDGEELDLSGLVITLTDSEDNTKTVLADQLEENGIMADKSGNLSLSDNGTPITFTKDGKPAATDNLTVSANKDALQESINQANNAKDTAKYENASYDKKNAFDEALEKANKVNDDQGATQAQVDAAKKALDEARGALDGKKPSSGSSSSSSSSGTSDSSKPSKNSASEADKGDLQDAVDNLNNDLNNGTEYTDETVKDVEEAIREAEKVLDNKNATQEDIDKALDNVKNAKRNMRLEVALETVNRIPFMFGYPDGTFGGDRSMTRAEVAAMFSRIMLDKPVEGVVYPCDFSDVFADDWYANVIGFMSGKGLLAGYPDGTFRPDDPITRAEFAALATRFAKIGDVDGKTFNDVDGHWAEDVIEKASAVGWVGGYEDATFKPDGNITRAEATAIANRMMYRTAENQPADQNKFVDVQETYWAYNDIMEATE